MRLAQNRAYDIGVVVAGDRDLAEPVRVAQDEGRRIIVASPEGASIATELKQLADEMIALDATIVRGMFDVTPKIARAASPTAGPAATVAPES